ncbi:MAG: helicase-related protein [Thermomicrobiales bacterium]
MAALAMDTAPAVRVAGDRAEVRFGRYDLAAYSLFLRCKQLPEHQLTYDWETDTYTVTTPARFARLLGVAGVADPPARLAPGEHLFDYQRFILTRALDARRYAAWLDTGLGKTPLLLDWSRQVGHLTGGKVLILVPTLELVSQHQEAAARFHGSDLPLTPLSTRADLAAWCIAPGGGVGIATYAKLIPGQLPELRHLAGLVADESSILKSGGGTIKWNLIKSARGIEYKLSCTATPAPNETMEYASQASFLEKLRTEGDILWTYFTRDKHGNWRVKPHARRAFYAFMATWSIYLRDPARFGFADILATLPEPEIHEYRLEMTPTQRELMQGFLVKRNRGFIVDDRLGVQERSKLSQLAKGFLYDRDGDRGRHTSLIPSPKPAFVADLARTEVRDGRQVLIWTVFDAESTLIADELADLPGVAVLDGAMKETDRAATIARFKTGDLAVLISKASLIGYGLNFQQCRAMIFSGFDDSFERLYQAIRRCYRFGQTETVRVHLPYIPELEGLMLTNVKRKQAQFDEDAAIQERFYQEALGLAGGQAA